MYEPSTRFLSNTASDVKISAAHWSAPVARFLRWLAIQVSMKIIVGFAAAQLDMVKAPH
jgi:hypothetical protein